MIAIFTVLLGGATIYYVLLKKFPEMNNGSATTWTYMNSVMLGVSSLVTLFTVIVCSANVSAEFASGTIKQLLIRPYERWKILLSKYIAVTIYSLLLLLTLVISGYLIGLIFFGGGGYNATFEEFSLTGTFKGIIGTQVIKKILLFIPGLFIITAISFMLSTLFKSQALAVGVGVFVLFFNSTVGGILYFLMEKFTWTKYLIFSHLDLSIYALQDSIAPGVTIGFSSILLAAYYILFMTITFLFFQKRDISF